MPSSFYPLHFSSTNLSLLLSSPEKTVYTASKKSRIQLIFIIWQDYLMRRPYTKSATKNFYSKFLLRISHCQMQTVYHTGKISCGVSEGLLLILIFSLEVRRKDEELSA